MTGWSLPGWSSASPPRMTGAGRYVEAAVRDVEQRLYAEIDAATAGLDMRPVIEALRQLSAGQLAGNAVQNRISTHHDSAGGITETAQP